MARAFHASITSGGSIEMPGKEELTCQAFVWRMKGLLDELERHWAERHASDRCTYPETMDFGDWVEFLGCDCDLSMT